MIQGNVVVDFQTHVFPKKAVDLARKENGQIKVQTDSSGGLLLYDEATKERFNALPDNLFEEPESRVKKMVKAGIDMEVLSFPSPGPDIFGERLALPVSRAINDEISGMIKKYPGHFTGLASLPFSKPAEAVDELKRAVNELGLKGIMTYANINGKFLDAPEFEPILKAADSLGVPLYVHPTVPVSAKSVGAQYNLNLVFGWPFDVTLTVSRLALSGKLKKLPNLKIIVPHGGAMFPFFNMRLKVLFSSYARDLAGLSSFEDPLSIFQNVYADTAIYYTPAVECAISFFTPERCVFASDYPYGDSGGIDFIERSIKCIQELKIHEEDRARIFGLNALKVLKVK